MTLAKLVEQQVSRSENLNSTAISSLLQKNKVTVESAKFNQRYKDEIMYDLGRVNRC
jgi:hypothetical protein